MANIFRIVLTSVMRIWHVFNVGRSYSLRIILLLRERLHFLWGRGVEGGVTVKIVYVSNLKRGRPPQERLTRPSRDRTNVLPQWNWGRGLGSRQASLSPPPPPAPPPPHTHLPMRFFQCGTFVKCTVVFHLQMFSFFIFVKKLPVVPQSQTAALPRS